MEQTEFITINQTARQLGVPRERVLHFLKMRLLKDYRGTGFTLMRRVDVESLAKKLSQERAAGVQNQDSTTCNTNR